VHVVVGLQALVVAEVSVFLVRKVVAGAPQPRGVYRWIVVGPVGRVSTRLAVGGIGRLALVVVRIPAFASILAAPDARKEGRQRTRGGLHRLGPPPAKRLVQVIPQRRGQGQLQEHGVHARPALVVDHVGAAPRTDLCDPQVGVLAPVGGELVARGHDHVTEPGHFRGRLFTGVAGQEAVGEALRHAGQLFYAQPLRDNIKACVRVVRLGYLIRQQETVEARRIVEYGGRCHRIGLVDPAQGGDETALEPRDDTAKRDHLVVGGPSGGDYLFGRLVGAGNRLQYRHCGGQYDRASGQTAEVREEVVPHQGVGVRHVRPGPDAHQLR